MEPTSHHRAELERIARRTMIDRDLRADFAPAVLQAVDRLDGPAIPKGDGWQDLTSLPWCSIDNDDSRDLDQLTVAERLDAKTRMRVAVADVDALVAKGGAIDEHAQHNTTSVYVPGRVFPMLPEKLCTDLTSLNPGVERLAIVVEIDVDDAGNVEHEDVYRAVVRNQVKLAYPAVGDFLQGKGPLPEAGDAIDGLDEQLRLQDRVAQSLKWRRFERGSLELETHQPRAEFSRERVTAMHLSLRNPATELIENFMVAANTTVARFLREHGASSLRRVVRSPERWERLRELAMDYKYDLPREPDAPKLRAFLAERRRADALRFPDLSLTVVKLLGRGEYVIDRAEESRDGHFALAVQDYVHATAPNRRFPDLVNQRAVKAVLDGRDAPYRDGELAQLGSWCTQQETAADKVERRVRKSASALLLEDRVGEVFDGVVTGASHRGTWVRLLDPPCEGKVVEGERGMNVGNKVRVRLVKADADAGFLDFERAK